MDLIPKNFLNIIRISVYYGFVGKMGRRKERGEVRGKIRNQVHHDFMITLELNPLLSLLQQSAASATVHQHR
jgi:hypothetical protein